MTPGWLENRASVPIAALGSLAFDTISTPFGRRERILGGSGFYFGLAAAQFAPVELLGIVGTDFPEKELRALHERGVFCDGVERHPTLPSFFWEGAYSENLTSRETIRTDLNVMGVFRPTVTERFARAPLLFLGNFDPAIQFSVIEQCDRFGGERLIALDTMNYWILGHSEALHRVLSRTHLLIINDSEARELSGQSDLNQAARKILTFGPTAVIIKLGEHGARLFHRSGAMFTAPALPVQTVIDPTGAGDTFAGGLVGYLAGRGATQPTMEEFKRAVVFGSVFGSIVVEAFGMDALLTIKVGTVLKRVEAFRELMSL